MCPVQVGQRRMAGVLQGRRVVVATGLPVVRVLAAAPLVVGVARRRVVAVQVRVVAVVHLSAMVVGRMRSVTVSVPVEGPMVLRVAVRVLRVAVVEGVVHHHVVFELLLVLLIDFLLLFFFLLLLARLGGGRARELVEVGARGHCHGPPAQQEGLLRVAGVTNAGLPLLGRLLRPRSGERGRRRGLARRQVLAGAHRVPQTGRLGLLAARRRLVVRVAQVGPVQIGVLLEGALSVQVLLVGLLVLVDGEAGLKDYHGQQGGHAADAGQPAEARLGEEGELAEGARAGGVATAGRG